MGYMVYFKRNSFIFFFNFLSRSINNWLHLKSVISSVWKQIYYLDPEFRTDNNMASWDFQQSLPFFLKLFYFDWSGRIQPRPFIPQLSPEHATIFNGLQPNALTRYLQDFPTQYMHLYIGVLSSLIDVIKDLESKQVPRNRCSAWKQSSIVFLCKSISFLKRIQSNGKNCEKSLNEIIWYYKKS